MNSPTITMERDAALAKLEAYETAAQLRPGKVRDEDRHIMRGYRVLARGGRLVDVNEAIRHGGLNLAGLPKLAMARADATETQWEQWYGEASGRFVWDRRATSWGKRFSGDAYQWWVPAGGFSVDLPRDRKSAKAFAPLIPLPHRPAHALSNYFLLWEANWHPAPPVDPYLLRPITGSLMEIVAEWDVSPVELAAVRVAMRTR